VFDADPTLSPGPLNGFVTVHPLPATDMLPVEQAAPSDDSLWLRLQFWLLLPFVNARQL